jgi:adenylylsulfate kinase
MEKGLIFWFTGMSGAGKTTVAKKVEILLKAAGYSVLVLDGDDIRSRLHCKLGFSEADIKENNRLIAVLCQKEQSNYDLILVPIISPYRISRSESRDLFGRKFYEIYFSADLEVVSKRDVKGLYAKAKRKEISNLIGFSESVPYEPPKNPDLTIDSGKDSIEKSVGEFYNFVINKLSTRG